MRIAIITEVFLPKVDGIVTRLTGTLTQLRELGHEALVFAPGKAPAEYAGHRVVRVPSVSFGRVYPDLRVGFPGPRHARELHAFRPDVVHVVNPVWTGSFGALYAERRKHPMLGSFHTDVPAYARRLGLGALARPAEAWIRRSHNRASVNLCTSQQMIEKARGFGIENLDLWPKAVDTERFTAANASREMRARLTDGHPDAPLILSVGRLSKEKDLDLLRHALDRAPQGTRLAFVGDGPAAADLRALFRGTPTVFTGPLRGRDLDEAYASADVFAFPSTTETLGLVALEAMASGTPVVGADAGGIPFAVPDGVGGLLARPRDAADLSEKLNRVLTDAGLRSRLAEGARAATEPFGWRASTEALVGFYERAIAAENAKTTPPRAEKGRSRTPGSAPRT
ncbi:glycosyltransferase family 4 protein [Microbacterium indicum]|uniref:glycosyltransferase family 4 protein n=1 Tax=Microbacterium indicum TaxID=358100 RepID=UPI00040A7E2D|nr:glycosyltransferase family 1 protein [Microbacterium indicum]